MHVVELLAELAVGAHVEIVVALLPEMVAAIGEQTAGDPLLQGLQGCGQRVTFGLAQQQMHVFRHDDVSVDVEPVVAANSFECLLEGASGRRIRE